LQSESAIFKVVLIGSEHQVTIAKKPSASIFDSSAALEAEIPKNINQTHDNFNNSCSSS
jgi:hypothetical protein